MHTLNGKIFTNEKTSSLIWTKGAEMHTHLCGFQRKNFYLVKRSPHLFGIGRSIRNLFFRKIRKIFEKIVRLKKHPSLVFTGRGCLGTVILKKQKICPPVLAGIKIPKGVLSFGNDFTVYKYCLDILLTAI